MRRLSCRYEISVAAFLFLLLFPLWDGLVCNILANPESVSLQAMLYPSECELKSRFSLIKGEIMHQAVGFYGAAEGIKEAKLILDLPEGMELLYAFHTPTGSGRPVYELGKPIERLRLERDNKVYARHTIHLRADLLKKTIPKNSPSEWTHANVFMYFKSSVSSGKGRMFYHVDTDGKSGVEKEIECIFMPPLDPLKLPREVKFYAIAAGDLACPNKEVWEGLYSLYDKIGIRGSYAHFPPAVSEELAKRGWLILSDVGYGWGWWWVNSAQEIVKEGIPPQEVLAVLRTGEKTNNPKVLCPTYLIQNGRKGEPFFEILRKRVESRAADKGIGGIFDDFEQEWTKECSGINSCFCSRCRQAFFEFSGVRTEGLSPAEILAKRKTPWLQFRVWQNAQMVRILAEVIKAVNPTMKFIVCSAPITWGRLPQQGYDIRANDQYVDEHWPMAYETDMGLMYIVDATVRALKRPVTPILNTCYPFGEHSCIHAFEVERNILASVASGAKGIAFFTGTVSLDGSYIQAIAKAAEKVAGLEDFFANGVRDDSLLTLEANEWSGVKHRAHRLGQRLLISLFNYNPHDDVLLKIQVPNFEAGGFYIYDPFEKEIYVGSDKEDCWRAEGLRKGFIFAVPKDQMRFLVVSPARVEGFRKVNVGSKEIQKAYDERVKETERDITNYLATAYPQEIVLDDKDDAVAMKCAGLDRNEEFTFSLWAWMDDRGIDAMLYRNVIFSWNNQEGKHVRFTITNVGRIAFEAADNYEVASHSDRVLSPGRWHHLAIAYNKGIARLFIDGIQPPDGINRINSGVFPKEGDDISIGKDKRGNFFKGKIKDVRVFNRALYEGDKRHQGAQLPHQNGGDHE